MCRATYPTELSDAEYACLVPHLPPPARRGHPRLRPLREILDCQSVKTRAVGGVRGYDGAKKLSGRQRHLLVDTQRLVLRVVVHTAALQARAAVPLPPAGRLERLPDSGTWGQTRATPAACGNRSSASWAGMSKWSSIRRSRAAPGPARQR